VVGPVRGRSLSPAPARVNPAAGLSAAAASRRQAAVIQPIKKARVAEEIADRIRVLILDGTLPTGQPLPAERQLAARFRVSRGSVRDACLLETRHGQGTFARELDVDRLVAPLASILTYRRDLSEELLDVRRMFEPAVARFAATRITDDDIADLQRILDTQRRKLKAGAATLVEDTAFHAALARATRNRVVMRLMETLNDLLIESRKATLRQKGRPEKSVQGHEAVVAALRRRDPDGAFHAMRSHIDQIAELLQRARRPRSTPPRSA
jgi:GntR family transcriptional repressor for pyruvate dehydrogenase complex